MILKYLWKKINKKLLFETVQLMSINLTLAKQSLKALSDNLERLKAGETVGYEYSTEGTSIQDGLTPFGGKDYRIRLYHTLEDSERSFIKLKDGLPIYIKSNYNDFDFDISNEKMFMEDTFQLLYLMWTYRNKDCISNDHEILVKSARRCTYDLMHLGSVRPEDKKMIEGFYTGHYNNIFTVKGAHLQNMELSANADYLFDMNEKLYEEYKKLKLDLPAGVSIIPF